MQLTMYCPEVAMRTSELIIESLRLENLEDHQVQPSTQHHQAYQTMFWSATSTCFFEHLQGRWLHHLPGQPVPTLDHSFSEEIFPNIQSKPPLTQLEAISSRAVASYLVMR